MALLMVVLGYAGVILYKTRPIDVYSMEKAGLFGDSFGVITCFFTALGFIGLLINLKEQRANSKKQFFENNFFQMLNHLNEITKDIDYVLKEPGPVITSFYGKSAFSELAGHLRNNYEVTSRELFFDPSKDEMQKVEFCYEKFWGLFGSKLGHYYRWLYNMLTYIDLYGGDNKDFYVKLVTAQLSNQELLLIYYNACFSRGKNFQNYIVKYQMMGNLESRELFLDEHESFISGVNFWRPK
ncbi:putative phage abortive infection protein [Pantoea sp. YR343]|uniref:putative phage abortive infection protein n=1 Tax=Pantoea sp. YR343 TaxID=1144341 RepID=UPI0012F6B9FC|nr:putative phage abortive infection protein [Pantoea sp. YR343]KAJ9434487.1 putative phage abortive infection protein [Pantoea sp. YR343]